MKTVALAPYADEDGNRIEYSGPPSESIKIIFRGTDNVARIDAGAHATKLDIDFNGSNGTFELGANPRKRAFSAQVRVGQDATVRIGHDVSATASVIISAVEGVSVDIGDDVMFASQNQVRADDGHPIFDIRTGARINQAQSISIGAHTWLGFGAIVLAGVSIGEGSVIGATSVVTRDVPNNVVAVGSPAAVVRRDIAWERPHLGLTRPFYKPDASTVRKSAYWRYTVDEAPKGTRPDGTQPAPTTRRSARARVHDAWLAGRRHLVAARATVHRKVATARAESRQHTQSGRRTGC